MNADVRCTVVSNYQQDDLLYDMFYRLNTGSVPLSTQELRQVLSKGGFADFLIGQTENILPVHRVLNLDEADPRLRDVEIVLRYLAFSKFGGEYQGNMKRFLDYAMRRFSQQWNQDPVPIQTDLHQFNQATQRALSILGDKQVGKKFVGGRWEGRFNKSLFEAEIYYIARIPDGAVNVDANGRFTDGLKNLCENDARFRASIEATTKTVENYLIRFEALRALVNGSYGLNIADVPVRG
jgi:hypothetical protein